MLDRDKVFRPGYGDPSIDIRLEDLPLAECICDFINPRNFFNYYTDRPRRAFLGDPYKDFVRLLIENPSFAASIIIGEGDFELMPYQCVIIDKMWQTPFCILLLSRGASKTTLLGIYALLKCMLEQTRSWGHKVVIVSASFRQSKNVMSGIETLCNRSPLVRACYGNYKGIKKSADMWSLQLGNASIVALPMGTGEKIRGQRASIILCDEYASIPKDIFSVVVRGFAAVASNPVKNVRLKVAKKRILARGGDASILAKARKNQIIRSGTGSHEFNHFFEIYTQYMRIIKNKIKGDKNSPKVRELLGDDIGDDVYIDYNDYCVFRMPYDSMPDGYMDQSVITEARLSMTEEEFTMEYGAGFVSDSGYFFKASNIVASTPEPLSPLAFDIELEADSSGRYVMGIDPARQRDDFALVILKIMPKNTKIVYAKKWHRRNYGELSLAIRDLFERFNIEYIGMDKGGGGLAVLDFLQTPEMIPEGQLPFFEVDDKDKRKKGLYVVDMINYMGKWISEANHSLKAEIAHQQLLFPSTKDETGFDPPKEAAEVLENIEELKSQLMKIEKTVIGKHQVEHFDLPDHMKKTAKKDLYSALLIAAHEARVIKFGNFESKYSDSTIGGALNEFV